MIYKCEDCEKSFANKSNYNRHFAKMHPETSEDEDFSDGDEDYDTEEEDEESDDEYSDKIDVWGQMFDESEQLGLPITTVYKDNILFMRAMKRDQTHKSVMETLEKVKDEENMDFAEALDYAIEKRRFLIQRQMPLRDNEMTD